jgi:hypothetical protein
MVITNIRFLILDIENNWYKVKLDNWIAEGVDDDMNYWIQHNTSELWCWPSWSSDNSDVNMSRMIYFQSEEDAVLFKLVWT